MKINVALSKSRTYEYIRDLETDDEYPGYVVKTADARTLIAQLPSPRNIKRDLDCVPSVPIRLLLSTSERLPRHIVTEIERSENKGNFTHKSLLGLCTSGRGLPVEIFLHDHFMNISDPSGELFEEVTWHETVHGIEGIERDDRGVLRRENPWSYELQQEMLAVDARNGHTPDFSDAEKPRADMHYLRVGTSLQDNVSELFARGAVIFMYEVKETGTALTSWEDLMRLIMTENYTTKRSRKSSNISDFLGAWGTFSDEAKELFFEEADNFVKRAAQLYGCDV